jgi:hypothetical protein
MTLVHGGAFYRAEKIKHFYGLHKDLRMHRWRCIAATQYACGTLAA